MTGRLGAALLVLATVAAGAAIRSATPDVEARERPFVHGGGTGQEIRLRQFTVTVQRARTAAEVERYGNRHDTGGIWVVVRVRVVAHEEPAVVGYAALRDGVGRLYRPSGRLPQPLADSGRTLQPGVPVVGDIVFEVPADAVGGLVLRIAAPALDQRLDAMAEIALTVAPGVGAAPLSIPDAAVVA